MRRDVIVEGACVLSLILVAVALGMLLGFEAGKKQGFEHGYQCALLDAKRAELNLIDNSVGNDH